MAGQLPPPFPATAPPVFWFVNPFTDWIADAIRQETQFKNMAVAIIDLTRRTRRADGAGFVTFAGWNLYDMRFAASMLKTTAMFAAFRLRENVREAAKQVSLTGIADKKKETALWDAIKADWKPAVEHAVPDGKPDFPHLDRMFDLDLATSQVNFSKAIDGHIHKMIEDSNTHSSGQVIDALGFQYLNGALAAEGLFSQSFGGLWLGANYNGKNWKKEPITRITHIGATAVATARFLSLMEGGRLVSPQASKEMRDLMSRAGSWYRGALNDDGRPPTRSYSKVGRAVGGTDRFEVFSECAVFERSSGGVGFRYALVGLSARSDAVLGELAIRADEYVRRSSGPPSGWN